MQRGSTLALVLGFFVTLVLAWYHGERGAQTVGGGELLMLALLLAVGGGLLWRFAGGPSAPMPTPEPPLALPADPAPAPAPAAAAPQAKTHRQTVGRVG